MDRPRPRRSKAPIYLSVAAACAVVLAALGTSFAKLGPAAPTVSRQAVWIAAVERGPMVRTLRGPGALTPEQNRWVTAVSAARVEVMHVEPGTRVEPDTVLVELSNPDLELASLTAASELAVAQAQLANLEATVETQVLSQRSTVATLQSEAGSARRAANANADLGRTRAIAGEEVVRSHERRLELDTRLDLEERRLSVLGRAKRAQLSSQRATVARLAAIAEFRARQVADLEVKAGFAGVLAERPIEVGQWVTPGTVLAKLVDPTKLKAELKVPEVQAMEVQVGQVARVDTRGGVVAGVVARIDPTAKNGTVTVDVRFTEPLPASARPALTVDGVVELERLDDVLHLRRPANAQPSANVGMFRVDADGHAVRVPVRLGRAAVDTIEIVAGLVEGDSVIVSDTTTWDGVDRLRLD